MKGKFLLINGSHKHCPRPGELQGCSLAIWWVMTKLAPAPELAKSKTSDPPRMAGLCSCEPLGIPWGTTWRISQPSDYWWSHLFSTLWSTAYRLCLLGQEQKMNSNQIEAIVWEKPRSRHHLSLSYNPVASVEFSILIPVPLYPNQLCPFSSWDTWHMESLRK